MAHARRPFAELAKLAKTTGKSHQLLAFFQKLYVLEKKAREGNYSAQQRYQLRLEHSKPILDNLKRWLEQSLKHANPQSKLANALTPFDYLQSIFEQIPFCKTSHDFDALLPSNFSSR